MKNFLSRIIQYSICLSLFGISAIANNYPPFEDAQGNAYILLNEFRTLDNLSEEYESKLFNPQTDKIVWMKSNLLNYCREDCPIDFVPGADYYKFAQTHELSFVTQIAQTQYVIDPNNGNPELIINSKDFSHRYPIKVTDRDNPNNSRFSAMFYGTSDNTLFGAIEPAGCTQTTNNLRTSYLYAVYLNINGEVITGCTSIEKKEQY